MATTAPSSQLRISELDLTRHELSIDSTHSPPTVFPVGRTSAPSPRRRSVKLDCCAAFGTIGHCYAPLRHRRLWPRRDGKRSALCTRAAWRERAGGRAVFTWGLAAFTPVSARHL